MKTIAELQPAGVKVVGALCMVRNSVRANTYVSDEIFTSKAGVRIRIGNTDAEGRMAMVDVVCRAKEMAVSDTSMVLTHLASTNHDNPRPAPEYACLAMGPYSIIMDNGAARADQTAQKMQDAGDRVGDMFEISTVNTDKSREFVAILQAGSTPSTRTPRSHQVPGAFLQQVTTK